MKKILLFFLLFTACESESLNKLELYDGLAIGYPTGDVLLYATLYNAGEVSVTKIECRFTLKINSDTLVYNETKNDTVHPGGYLELYHQFRVYSSGTFFGNIKVLSWKVL